MKEKVQHGNLKNNFMFKKSVCLALILCLYSSCGDNKIELEKLNEEKNSQKEKISVPKFNADSAFYYIQKQVSFGPRFLSSVGWKNCALWLEKN